MAWLYMLLAYAAVGSIIVASLALVTLLLQGLSMLVHKAWRHG